MKRMRSYLWLSVLFFSVVLTDQSSKLFFSKSSACNKNIAWSITIAPGIFYVVWAAIFFLLIYLLAKSKAGSEKAAIFLALSGATSNFIDRILRGCVVDFIDLKIWPVFNLADIYITMGLLLFILLHAKYKMPDNKN